MLESVRQRDMYGYELVEEVSEVIDVNEGTIYPLLKRLTNEHYFETYLRESSEGPPRKYYHLTQPAYCTATDWQRNGRNFRKESADF